MLKVGLVEEVLKALGDKCFGVFSDVPQDNGVGVVNRAAAFAREKEADCVVSVGGGSVINTGKMVCILLTEVGGLENFEGIQFLTRQQTPHIVIPTTAGTGSEVTCIAVILDERKRQKIMIVEYFNTPRLRSSWPENRSALSCFQSVRRISRSSPPKRCTFSGVRRPTPAMASREAFSSLERPTRC